MDGWIKLYRKLLDDAIWKTSTPEQCKILVTLLLMANHEENEWMWKGKKFKVKPGQFVTSLESIKEICGKGITIKNIRTALDKFQKCGFLANESAKTGRLITIVKWEVYQSNDLENWQSSRQTGGKQVATNKNDNKDKNNNYIEIIDYLNEKTGRHFRASTKEYQKVINARLKDYSVEELKKVVDDKCLKWTGKENLEEHLVPLTLFCAKHFDTYLNQATSKKKTKVKYEVVTSSKLKEKKE